MVYSQADARPCLLCPRKFQIQLESPLKAKGIAFPLKVEWHWLYVFFLFVTTSASGSVHECYEWIGKTLFVIYESLCRSSLEADFNPQLNFDSWSRFWRPRSVVLSAAFHFYPRSNLTSCTKVRCPSLLIAEWHSMPICGVSGYLHKGICCRDSAQKSRAYWGSWENICRCCNRQ